MKNQYIYGTKKKIATYERLCTQLKLREKDLDMQQGNEEYLNKEIVNLKHDIEKLESGFNNLDELQYKIIDMKYKERKSWIEVSFATGYCVSRCKEIGKEALMIVGEALYGTIVHQDLPLIAGQGYYNKI